MISGANLMNKYDDKQMMKICILCQREPNPNLGGIERVSYSLAKELAGRGISVFFVFSRSSISPMNEDCFPMHCLPNRTIDSGENVDFVSSLLGDNDSDILLNQAANRVEFVNLCSKVFERDPSVKIVSAIHFAPHQEWISLKSNCFLSKFGEYKPLKFRIARFFNDLMLGFKKGKVLEAETSLLRRVAEISRKVVVLSDAYVDEFSQMSSSDNIISIPNFIEKKEIDCNLGYKEKMVLYVGRLEYGLKRVDRLLHIWKEIEQKIPDWRLVVVGDGDYRRSFESLAKHLGLKHICFAGNQNPDIYYERASIICLTSSSEGLPMVFLEAVQYACVPISYDSFASLSDIVTNGENGFAVTPFQQDEFVEKLSLLMTDNQLRVGMAMKEILVMEKYDAQVIVPKWIELFGSLSHAN